MPLLKERRSSRCNIELSKRLSRIAHELCGTEWRPSALRWIPSLSASRGCVTGWPTLARKRPVALSCRRRMGLQRSEVQIFSPRPFKLLSAVELQLRLGPESNRGEVLRPQICSVAQRTRVQEGLFATSVAPPTSVAELLRSEVHPLDGAILNGHIEAP